MKILDLFSELHHHEGGGAERKIWKRWFFEFPKEEGLLVMVFCFTTHTAKAVFTIHRVHHFSTSFIEGEVQISG